MAVREIVNSAWIDAVVGEDVPEEAEFVLSALEAAGASAGADRRGLARAPYRAVGALRLYADGHGADGRVIYTRDVGPKGLGFVTRHRLPLGYGGVLELPGPGGGTLRLECTLLRCREAGPGWFEGAVYFQREQWQVEELVASGD